MNYKNLSTLLVGLVAVCAVSLVGCKKDKPSDDGPGGGEGGGNEVIDDPDNVAHFMNDNMILPPGSFTIDPATVDIDMSVEITSTGSDPIVGLLVENK